MILYFSATGNCKYVADRIAGSTGDKAVSIVDCEKQRLYTHRDRSIGIVSPTYYWALPSITRDFLKKADLQADYLYYVATYGTSPGAGSQYAQLYLGQRIDAFYSVRMPDTWTPVFDLSTPEKVAGFCTTTESDISAILGHIQRQECGQFMKARIPRALVAPVYPFYELSRRTKNLHVEASCVGCGLCAKKCPVGAIELREKKPVWVKDKCVMCLGCLHRCPKFAIHYGNGRSTHAHGQYRNPHVNI